MNYAGVIFGKEVFYDTKQRRIDVKQGELGDNFVKEDDAEQTRIYVLNIYLTLMTRGIRGTWVYAVDEDLRNYLKEFMGGD